MRRPSGAHAGSASEGPSVTAFGERPFLRATHDPAVLSDGDPPAVGRPGRVGSAQQRALTQAVGVLRVDDDPPVRTRARVRSAPTPRLRLGAWRGGGFLRRRPRGRAKRRCRARRAALRASAPELPASWRRPPPRPARASGGGRGKAEPFAPRRRMFPERRERRGFCRGAERRRGLGERPDGTGCDVLAVEQREPLLERAPRELRRELGGQGLLVLVQAAGAASSGRPTSSQSRRKNFGSSAPTVSQRPSAVS